MTKKICIFLFLYFLFVIAIIPSKGQSDLDLLVSWGEVIVSGGIHTAYANQINYPPIPLYVINVFAIMMKSLNLNFNQYEFILKDMFFVFDIATFFIVFRICSKFNINFLNMGIILFNLALIYNSLFWGQIDGMYTFFGLLSVYFILSKQPVFSFMCLLLSLDSKPQAFLFIPIVGILLLCYIWKDRTLFWKLLLFGGISQLIVFWPFIYYKSIGQFTHMMITQTTYFPKLSLNAFNLWVLMYGVDKAYTSSDLQVYLGISFKLWGFIFYIIGFIITFIPFLLQLKRWVTSKFRFTQKDWQIVFLTIAMTNLVFFFFNTEMHERYSHAIVIFAGVFALLSGRYIIYLFSSIAYLTNLTWVVNLLTISFNSFLDPRGVAILYLFILLFGTVYLYLLSLPKIDVKVGRFKLSSIFR